MVRMAVKGFCGVPRQPGRTEDPEMNDEAASGGSLKLLGPALIVHIIDEAGRIILPYDGSIARNMVSGLWQVKSSTLTATQ